MRLRDQVIFCNEHSQLVDCVEEKHPHDSGGRGLQVLVLHKKSRAESNSSDNLEVTAIRKTIPIPVDNLVLFQKYSVNAREYANDEYALSNIQVRLCNASLGRRREHG